MFTRSKSRTVHFERPFTLAGVEGIQPPGDYQVQDDEEQITGISWLAYRRVATLIAIGAAGVTGRFSINDADLEAALERDRSPPVAGL